MAGTKEGGRKAAAANVQKHGKDFYKAIGQMGGKKGHTGGFSNIELARKAGQKGGRVSRRVGSYSALAIARRHKDEILRRVEDGEYYAEIGKRWGLDGSVIGRVVREAQRND